MKWNVMNGVYIPVYKMGALGESKQLFSHKWDVKATKVTSLCY